MSDIASLQTLLAGASEREVIRIGLAYRDIRLQDAALAVGRSPSQLSNALAGRRPLGPEAAAALLELVGLQPLLVARSVGVTEGDARLTCDGVTLHGNSDEFSLEGAAEALCSDQGWVYARRRAHTIHARARHRDGLRVEWHRTEFTGAELRLELKPASLGARGRLDAAFLLAVPTSSWSVARVDVAADYPVPRHGSELLGVSTRSGSVTHEKGGDWIVPFEQRGSRVARGLRSSRIGSPRSETHVRCYAHSGGRGIDGASYLTRIEAQVRPRGHRRSRLETLPSMEDPFSATQVVVLDPAGLEYPWTSVVRDLATYGAAYVRARLTLPAWRDLLSRLGGSGRPLLHPTPSELFRAHWRSVATVFLADLGVLAEAEP